MKLIFLKRWVLCLYSLTKALWRKLKLKNMQKMICEVNAIRIIPIYERWEIRLHEKYTLNDWMNLFSIFWKELNKVGDTVLTGLAILKQGYLALIQGLGYLRSNCIANCCITWIRKIKKQQQSSIPYDKGIIYAKWVLTLMKCCVTQFRYRFL